MSKNDGGGAAFPHNEIHDQMAPYRHFEAQPGMTLREYFAAKAMTAVIGAIMPEEGHNWTHADFAHEACAIADALLAELAK